MNRQVATDALFGPKWPENPASFPSVNVYEE